MSALNSLLSGAAAPAPLNVVADATAAAAILPADVAAVLFAGTALPFQQLLADAADAALCVANSANAANTSNTADTADTPRVADAAATVSQPGLALPLPPLPSLPVTLATAGSDTAATDAALVRPSTDNATPRSTLARHRRDPQPVGDDPAALQLLAVLAPPIPLVPADMAPVLPEGVGDATATLPADASAVRDAEARPIGERAARAMEAALQQDMGRTAAGNQDGSNPRREPEGERRTLLMPALTPIASPAADSATAATAAANSLARTFNQTQSVERTVSVPFGHPQWPQAVAAEVRWCADNGVQSATLRLSPEHLGPVEVRVDVRDSQVNVSFGASHADTRAALEQALPKLRELFAGAGLSLGQASVQQEMRRESQNQSPSLRGLGRDDEIAAVSARVVALGLVDEYA